MKSILFHACEDDRFSGRLDAVLDLARAFDAHITLLHAMPYEAAGTADPYGAAFAAMVPIWREQARELRERTEMDLGNEDVPWDWVEKAGPPALALLRESSLSDLVVVGAREPGGRATDPSFTAGELAIASSCPVLVLPDDCTSFDVGKPALVAWDGSSEASHALRAALPLLQRARAVHLVTVNEPAKSDKKLDFPPVKGADYLARYDIRCEIVELDAGQHGVARALADAAEMRRAGLVVIGAYGRSRLSERIFGGVTRAMLSDVRVPLLLRH